MNGAGETREWTIPAQGEAVADARYNVRKTLADWGCEDLSDDIVLVVSELVTNAIRYGKPDIVLTLCCRDDRVGGQVTNGGDAWPRLEAAAAAVLWPDAGAASDVDAESGRGLNLVAAYTWRWGVRPAHSGPGSVAWFAYRRTA